jgi:hypothetical protein
LSVKFFSVYEQKNVILIRLTKTIVAHRGWEEGTIVDVPPINFCKIICKKYITSRTPQKIKKNIYSHVPLLSKELIKKNQGPGYLQLTTTVAKLHAYT